jgi:hypothetical protein
MVETDVDVRITDAPLNFRRPDITVYRCIPDDARLYLIVFLNAAQDAVEKVEEYWLEPTGMYRLVQLHTRRLVMNTPVPVDVSLDRLTLI